MEEIIRLQEYEPLWDEWRMDKFLYEGNLSNIYQVKNKENIGVIKVISVPKIQTEVGNGQNLENREQMNNYFREVVSVLENEISKLSILQEIPNILTYKKYQAFERSTEIGFDFILLMDKEQSLLEYVASKKITNKEIVRIVKEVAEILEKAHSEDIIHKDIKVENIFIGKNGEGILGDFALARKIESFQSRSYRKMDNVYTAPEVMSEYDYNVSTDIFALGMVLYLLLNNGEIPISCDRRTFKTEVPKPERAKEKLGSIALKAIAYRARDRYASAKEIYNALCELTEEDFELPVEYIEAEEARKKIQEEKENLQKEEAKKAEEERIRKEEEAKKAEEERIQREEEARKAEEERIRREEEAKKAEEERIRREEEARKAEEERIRREEEARKAEEERIREEEKRRLELIRIAEEERKREAEERLMKENEDAQSLIANTEICQEGSLHGASIQLNATISDMEKSVYDETDERNKKVIENSSMEKSRQYAIEQAEQKLEKAMEESRMLLGQIEAEDAKPLYEIHANEREYSGFFNFEETVAFEEKKANKDYDQNIDQEPFEQQYIASTNVPTKASKKPLIFIAILLIIIGTGTLLYCNEATRTKIQDTYNKAIEYFENKDVASLSEKDVLAISKREY